MTLRSIVWSIAAAGFVTALVVLSCASGGAEDETLGSTGMSSEARRPPVSGTIRTVAGGHTLEGEYSPRDVPLLGPCGAVVDPKTGALYLSDTIRHMVVRVSPDRETLRPIAGTQIGGFDGDGKPALETSFHVPC
ncbi:MAG: hypothetical protein PVG07_05510, partial [Acidobacteriota bacterium]